MASSAPSTDSKDKTPTTKRTASTKRAPAKPRTQTAAKSSATRKASTVKSGAAVPQWLTIGASITGAVVAVGATLFATRKEWLPRAKKLGEWVESSVQEQVENVTSVRSKKGSRNGRDLPVAAPHFEPSGASAAFDSGAAAH